MGLQKYRADSHETQADGAKLWFANWMGGPSLSKIENCRWATLQGEPRITAYIRGEADTYFSIPAACHYLGKTLKGYVTNDDDGNTVFHHCYYS